MKNNNNYKSFSIRLKNNKFKHQLYQGILNYKHLENMLFILQNEFIDNKKLHKLLRNKVIMKAVLMGNKGKEKTQENISFVNNSLKHNKIFQSMTHFCQSTLNDKNCSMIVERTNGNWNTYETQIKAFFKDKMAFEQKYKNKEKPQPPKAKRLAKVTSTSLPLESSKWSIIKLKDKQRKGKANKNREYLGITLGKRQIKIPLLHKGIIHNIGVNNINNATLSLRNNCIYVNFTYLVTKEDYAPVGGNKKSQPNKKAAIDIGLNNLLSLFVHDNVTQSILYDGRKIKSKNTQFNRIIAKLNQSISNEAIEFKTAKNEAQYAINWTKRGFELKRFKTFLIEKRNRYFDNEFHKLSKNIVKFLTKNNINELVISKNLSFAKTQGDIKLNKKVKQNFMHIPFGMLLNRIEQKCQEKSIEITLINEAYTSKTSCLSTNIHDVLQKCKEKKLTTTDYGGGRVVRGLFVDKSSNKAINADLNGAANHIKVAFPKENLDYLNNCLFKLCNPMKIKSNNDFNRYLAA